MFLQAQLDYFVKYVSLESWLKLRQIGQSHIQKKTSLLLTLPSGISTILSYKQNKLIVNQLYPLKPILLPAFFLLICLVV